MDYQLAAIENKQQAAASHSQPQQQQEEQEEEERRTTRPPSSSSSSSPLKKIIMVASIAAGVQFGWALQLSLLTPYVQLLGIPHKWAAFIWLCGPVSGMFVQPGVCYFSDRCSSRFGRRRPFIATGATFVAVAVFLIGFAADIGRISKDPLANTAKPRAIAVFAAGFWILDSHSSRLRERQAVVGSKFRKRLPRRG